MTTDIHNIAASPATAGANPAPAVADDGADDPRVASALEEYLAAVEAGHAPNRGDFLARHAAIAAALGRCLDSLAIVMAAAPRMRGLAGEDESFSHGSGMPAALGDFRIEREIGRGGMGVVYEAVQLSLGRKVAVKVLPFASALDATRLQRFKNEAQAAAQLHHTNIVPVYAVGCERGLHFYAMQLIEGRTLASVIGELRQTTGSRPAPAPARDESKAAGPPTEAWSDKAMAGLGAATEAAGPRRSAGAATAPAASHETLAAFDTVKFTALLSDERKTARAAFFRTAVRLGVQAAEALDHAHQMGVIHRDIKPGNLLVDSHGKLWITDFGLAQFHAEATLTLTGNLPGTVRYMSPEQATGRRALLDHRTDIYSLGITLYELLTLEPAFDDRDGRILVRHIAAEEPRAPRSIDRAIPADLETILLKAMSKAPTDRYASAQALADDLQRFLEHQPIRARRPRVPERMVKWGRRHKPLVFAGILLLAMTALGLLVSTVLIAREHAKTRRAYESEYLQRVAAERNFRQARAAVDTFTQLGEEELIHRPSMYSLRRKFLETALDYYESFLDQHQDDPDVQAELDATRRRVAEIVDELSVLSGLGPLLLVSNEHVQDELGLAPEKREQVNQLVAQLYEQCDQVSRDDRPAGLAPTEQQHELTDILRSHEENITEAVGPSLMHRVRQIALQQQGPFAFRRPEVIEALALSPEQRLQITDVIEAHAPHRQGPRRDFHGGPDGPSSLAMGMFRTRHGPPEPGGHAADDSPGGRKPPPPPHSHDAGPSDSDEHCPPGEEDPLGHGPGDDGPESGHGGSPERPPRFGGSPRRGPHGPGDKPPHHGPGDNMRATMDRTVEAIVAILTPEQQATWQALVGAPFSHDLGFSKFDSFLF